MSAASSAPNSADAKMIALLEDELKSSDDRYLRVRSQLLKAFTSNAQLLEYTQYLEDQIAFYRHKADVNGRKNEIRATRHKLPPINFSPSNIDRADFDDDADSDASPAPAPPLDADSDGIRPQRACETMVRTLSDGDCLTMNSLLSAICSSLDFDAASIFSISRSLDLVSCEASTLQHLGGSFSCSLSHCFLSQIVEQKQSILIANVHDEPSFEPETDDRFFAQSPSGRRTASVRLEPLCGSNGEMVGILEMVRCGDSARETPSESVLEAFSRNIASVLLSAALVQRDLCRSNEHKEALRELAKVMGSSSKRSVNIEALIERVRGLVYRSVRCDKVAVFMVDEMRQELWCSASDDVSGLRLSLGTGIVGHVVGTGQPLNIHNAYTDPRFNSEVDRKTGYHTKSILCVPIKYSQRIIGAMECINKCDGDVFSEADTVLLTQMVEETASLLQSKFMASALRITSEGLQDSSSRDYLSQFMRCDDALRARGDATPRRQSLTISRPIAQHSGMHSVCSWDLDYFALAEDGYQTAIGMVLFMLRDLGLLARFQIPGATLTAFVVAVERHYFDNPYHNFLHAFSVVHVCYLLLKTTAMRDRVDDLDTLSLFIAALCHDLEHPGLTNAFQVNTNSDLALQYNDCSVLENHHAHCASLLLLKKPGTAILEGLDAEEQPKVRKAMISIILHTDMSYHQEIVSQLHRFADRTRDLESAELPEADDDDALDPTDRLFLSQAVVHLGDLSNPVMSWDQSRKWSQRVIAEFVEQSKLEKEQGIKPSMAFLADGSREGIAKMQLSFIDYVVKPLWKNALSLAPELRERLDVLEENRRHWIEYQEAANQLPAEQSPAKE